jgi:hypothetical protein
MPSMRMNLVQQMPVVVPGVEQVLPNSARLAILDKIGGRKKEKHERGRKK